MKNVYSIIIEEKQLYNDKYDDFDEKHDIMMKFEEERLKNYVTISFFYFQCGV